VEFRIDGGILLIEMVDLSNLRSWEDVVELLVPELQRGGIYWEDYAVPGGTFRENMQVKPGQHLLPDDHSDTKLRWNAKKAETSKVLDSSDG
jgi:hypothetical protein